MRFRPNNASHLSGGITQLVLKRRSGETLDCFVDTLDYPSVSGHRWNASTATHKPVYAVTNIYRTDGRRTSVAMHQMLVSKDGESLLTPDHRDRNGLNNRRSNLRLASQAQQNANSGRSVLKFRGVFKRRKRFEANIKIGGKVVYLGLFKSRIEAADVYDAAAKRCYGEFASLNFPEETCILS
jgi:hypothetical protein